MGVLLTDNFPSGGLRYSTQAGREALVLILCFCGALLLQDQHIDVSKGVLPDIVSALPFIGHKGFVCPLCGGVRSFVMVSSLSLPLAFHYSMLGTCISLWALLTIPVRVLFCLFPTKRLFRRGYFLLRKCEHPDVLIILMAMFMWMQLFFHYYLNFPWIPLEQLNQV